MQAISVLVLLIAGLLVIVQADIPSEFTAFDTSKDDQVGFGEILDQVVKKTGHKPTDEQFNMIQTRFREADTNYNEQLSLPEFAKVYPVYVEALSKQ
ncbi:unnamed protein product, partial [Mesorhabditis spiculigera]